MSSFLGTEVVADLYEFGIAIYEVDNPIPESTIECIQPWGECPLEQGTYPIPADAEPAPGDDGTMVIVDRAAGRTVELWQPVPLGDGSWRTSWGTTTPLDGSGIPDVFGNGAGISHLAGVVRVDEIAAGQIDHALVFSTNNACREEFRYPAVKTDGTSPRADCIPEGARVQLDPSIDIDTIRLSPAARAIARALQVYGAYAVDSGGSAMALYFEVADDASFSTPGATYVAAGLKRDYADLSEIPWRHLRVLRAWDGS
jgi:hypothetical protein